MTDRGAPQNGLSRQGSNMMAHAAAALQTQLGLFLSCVTWLMHCDLRSICILFYVCDTARLACLLKQARDL